ncbi:thioredoxin fold domain-containing protein [Hymenobacter busanensis]|uniref:Thioredoxin fold domain-containing protein n=1 Tax=Hymenobacter busanensis TaxID=2607656 RepID=A0A7L5A0W5_9BACT|nr:cytochrome c biogenesis protein CcdA [Hymenobacter busanensis]KAA9338415.1 thioredoxin fold domain-containing protein [Hymenobacter busanensis]QHJ09158.1 thioredoxin fold domain-containing protein [Hymenobacter busanensis]
MYLRKTALLSWVLLWLTVTSWAQVLEPTKLATAVSKPTAKVGDEVDLIVNARIEPTWHLYATDFDPDLGPTVFTFNWTKSPAYELVGAPKSVGTKKKFDTVFKGDVTYFETTGQIRQRIRLLQPGTLNIKAGTDYQSCTDTDGRCVPGSDALAFGPIEVSGTAPAAVSAPATAAAGQAPAAPATAPLATAPAAATSSAPAVDSTTAPVAGSAASSASVVTETPVVASGATAVTVAPAANEAKPAGTTALSLWQYLALAFGAGLLAVLMPCVYPMLPMTVSYFTSTGGSRSQSIAKALVYGLSIVAIYTGVGVVLSLALGADAANVISSHWLPNVVSFGIFVLFGLSFLGLFEIQAPTGLVNKVDRQADKGGWSGLFFMAATLVLVSFSCTVPFVGSVAIASAGGELLRPTLGMMSFALAFALPFVLFALFPSALKSLPRSGGWLNTLKVMMGFVELALAFKFLSSADLSYHWGLLPRAVFVAIWVVLAGLLGLYLLGFIRLPHDDESTRVSVPRLLLAAVSFTFMFYLVPGLFGAPLPALSALLPPPSRHDFSMAAGPAALPAVAATDNATALCEAPRHGNFLELPLNLQGYFDLQQALRCARQQNKPVFVDFTGHNCGNCRLMEASVWSDPQVLQRLQRDYVVVALYVDDKTELPQTEWYTSKRDNRVKKAIGEQNLDFEISRFQANAQPYYVLLSPDGQPLAEPLAYEPDVARFVQFLDRGLQQHRAGQPVAQR